MKNSFIPQTDCWRFCLCLLVCSFPISAHADYTNLRLQESCLNLIKERTQAFKDQNWDKLVGLARSYMFECDSIADRRSITLALDNISFGLNQLGQYKDSIPIAKKCLIYTPEYSSCIFNLGKAYLHTGKFVDAQLLFQQVIDIGGYDTLTAAVVENAKQELIIAKLLTLAYPARQPDAPHLGIKEAEPFVQITLPYRIKVELPHNWVIADSDQKQYVLSKTQSTLNLAGIKAKDSRRGILLIARPVQKEKYAAFTVSVQTTDLRYTDVEKMTPQDIQRWGDESRDALDKGLRASGGRLIEWIEPSRNTWAGKPVLIKKYKRDSEFGKGIFVVIAQFHDAPRLISISMSAREGEEDYWKPIMERIAASIQFF